MNTARDGGVSAISSASWRAAHQTDKIRKTSKLGMKCIVTAFFGADGIGATGVVGVRLERIVAALAIGAADRVIAGITRLPEQATWRELYGVAILCVIGFTMSLFIGLLAFVYEEEIAITKLAVLLGSLLSALVGWRRFFGPNGERRPLPRLIA